MSRRESKRGQAVLDLTAHIMRTGLAEISLRQLADAAGVSDRMLLYYFQDKDDVLTAVMTFMADQFGNVLEAQMPVDHKLSPAEMFATLSQMIGAEPFQSFMKLWIEIMAEAARGTEPYKTVAANIAQSFIDRIDQRLTTKDHAQRRRQATMIIAMIDGMALLALLPGFDLDAAREDFVAVLG